MAHMTPDEFLLEKHGREAAKYELDHEEWLGLMQAYHDYSLEQAAKDAKAEILTDRNGFEYASVNKQSILQHKFIK